jgi:hypothetical protein
MEIEDWKEYKLDQKSRRLKRVVPRREQILSLKNLGYDVKQLTPYQFRINDEIDLYPIHNRYFKIRYKKWGGYKDAEEFIKKSIKK